jgi:hypothetical protein
VLVKGVKISLKDLELYSMSEQDRPHDAIKLTEYEVGMQQDKNLIVPSFGTASSLFASHFTTLRQLRRRVDLLKQAYYSQMDQAKCWEQIDQIIAVLDSGSQYLSAD